MFVSAQTTLTFPFNLESLLSVQGVIAALRFSDDGSLVESAGELERTHRRLAVDICYTNGRMMHQGGDMLMTLSDMKGWPPHGWMMMGDELSISTRSRSTSRSCRTSTAMPAKPSSVRLLRWA